MKYDWRVGGTEPAMRVVDATGREWPDVVAVDTDTGIITCKVKPGEGTEVVVDQGEDAVVDIAVPAPVTVEFGDGGTAKPHKAPKSKATKHAKDAKDAKDDDAKDDEE